MSTIFDLSHEEFKSLTEDELAVDTRPIPSDYNMIMGKCSDGGIRSKEELALFLAFKLWDNTAFGGNIKSNYLDRQILDNGKHGCVELNWLVRDGSDSSLRGREFVTSNDDEVGWDIAFWNWNRKCHGVAERGFWAVLSKINPSEITTNQGQERLAHYRKVAQALNVNSVE